MRQLLNTIIGWMNDFADWLVHDKPDETEDEWMDRQL
jgi:hypothetical protein